MNKELEAYRRLCIHLNYKDDYLFNGGWREDDETIETALKEKENIEKTINELFSDNGKVITTIDIKKQLKALVIIKEKMVNTAEFISYVKDTNHNYETYLLDYSQEYWYLHINDNNETSYCLTQEEYGLLKEVLL